MKVREIMTGHVIGIGPEESVCVASRTLAHYNVGALPVCGEDGRVCGFITDRDIVTRCLAANRSPESTPVGQIMTGSVLTVTPETEAAEAARLMGRQQIRRLPVVQNGRLCGMVSLADLVGKKESSPAAEEALRQITSNISSR